MTRRDYELIAAAIYAAKRYAWKEENDDILEGAELVEEELTKAFTVENPRFSRVMFETACNGQ